MAQRIHRYNVLSPYDSPLPSYTSTRVDFAPGNVTAITVEIPSGHHGLTGIAIFYNDAQLIPKDGSAYLRGSHKTIRYEFDDPHPGGVGWYAQHFNGDHFYDHTFHLSVEIEELEATLGVLPKVLLLRQSGEAGLDTGGGGIVPVPSPGGGSEVVQT